MTPQIKEREKEMKENRKAKAAKQGNAVEKSIIGGAPMRPASPPSLNGLRGQKI
jgi:hypothetical protein